MSRIRSITAAVTAVAVMGAGGLGVADAATSSGTTTKSTTSSSSTVKRNGKPGPRAMSATTLAAIAKAIGVSSADLKAAMDANKPAKPTGTKADRGAGMAADLASALGVQTSAVQTILDANRPAKPADGTKPAPGTKPDESKLVAALASGLNLSEATVTAALTKLHAAHEADHTAREAAMYAAIAKKLNVDAATVRAAFEANRPAPPTSATTATT
jgi:hypothetical protein